MEIKSIGIIGSGVMGSQIAELFLKHGFDVILHSRSKEGIERCVGRFKQKDLSEKLATTTNIEDLKDKNLIIESVKEYVNIKQEIFEKLDNMVEVSTIVASNTSSIPISLISKNCKNKERLIGLHFSNPALHMKLVEVPVTDHTSEETINRILQLIKKIGKDPIIVKDVPGFLLNRMMFVMLNEAANLLYENAATKEEIDKTLVLGANHPLGPLKIMDLVGIDVTVDILKNLQKELKNDKFTPSPILLQMLEENRLGKKTKKGFYDY